MIDLGQSPFMINWQLEGLVQRYRRLNDDECRQLLESLSNVELTLLCLFEGISIPLSREDTIERLMTDQ